MRSLFSKYFSATAVLILSGFLVLGLAFSSITYQWMNNQQKEEMAANADLLASYVRGNVILGQRLILSPYFQSTMRLTAEIMNATTMMVDLTGQIIESSDQSKIGRFLPESTIKLLAKATPLPVSDFGFFDVPYRIESRSIQIASTGQTVAYLLIAAPAREMELLAQWLVSVFLITGMIVLMAIFMVTYVVTRRMVRPLRSMSAAAASFAQGQFDVRVEGDDQRGDEVGQLAHAFNAMADALQKAEELRSGFIANVSHELKTPMTTISGYISGILDGVIPPERQSEYLGVVRDEILRLSRLVSRMLDIARLQAKENEQAFTNFDVAELIRRILLGFDQKIETKRLSVNVQLPDEPVIVHADPDGIAQVVTNLLDNAVKFALPQTPLAVSLAKRGGKIQISVTNHAPDIPPDDLLYIFDRFHKEDKSRGIDRSGLGLGLYIVRTILGNLGETVWVTSQNGLTCFTFTLSEAKK